MAGTISNLGMSMIVSNNLQHDEVDPWRQNPAALVLTPPSWVEIDYNGALATPSSEFLQIKLSEFRYTIVRNFTGNLHNDIQSASGALQGRQIDTLVISSHGYPSGLQVTRTRRFCTRDIQPLTNTNLARNLKIILMACDTAREIDLTATDVAGSLVGTRDFKSFARVFAETTQFPVYAVSDPFDSNKVILRDCPVSNFRKQLHRTVTHGIELQNDNPTALQNIRLFLPEANPNAPCAVIAPCFCRQKEITRFITQRENYKWLKAHASRFERSPL